MSSDGRRRVLAVALIVVLYLLCQLLVPWTEIRTDVGAEGVGEGTFPVVEVAGLGSRGVGFATLTRRLQDHGVPVLDFDPDQAGVQPLTYRPTDPKQHITDLAEAVVGPEILAALERAGYAATQRVDVVAHSMGGLVMRYLVEAASGEWADRVDDLVMVATPNHGSTVVWLETRLGDGPFNGLGADMRPGSDFLQTLGYDEPAGEVYTTIGGDPWLLRWLGAGSFGFDDQVPAISPFLEGAANNVYPSFHGRLLDNDDVLDLIAQTLRAV